jgi:hypothetical protein
MVPLYPQTITFSVFSDEVPKPTVTVRRDGTLKQKNASFEKPDVTVLLQGDDESVDITAKQYKAMVQLARVALNRNACVKIVFNSGASPWGLESLPGCDDWTTVHEAMAIQAVHISKILMRRRPMHALLRRILKQ